MVTQIRHIISDLTPIRRQSRLLYLGAAFWLAVGAFHIVVLAATGFEWSGAVSWRKPVVFSISIGLLLATVGWILDRLPERQRLASTIAWSFLVSCTIEVALIAMQTWRGRASHFNVFESGDALIFSAMGISVGIMSLCLVGVFIWSLLERPADPLIRLAVIAGMALVIVGLGFGQWIIGIGSEYVANQRAVPSTVLYGEAGVAKFPHAVALHGIQLFIVAGLSLRRIDRPDRWRRQMLWTAIGSYSTALVFSSVQTLTGNAPLSLSLWGVGFGSSLFVLAATSVAIIRQSIARPEPADLVAASAA